MLWIVRLFFPAITKVNCTHYLVTWQISLVCCTLVHKLKWRNNGMTVLGLCRAETEPTVLQLTTDTRMPTRHITHDTTKKNNKIWHCTTLLSELHSMFICYLTNYLDARSVSNTHTTYMGRHICTAQYHSISHAHDIEIPRQKSDKFLARCTLTHELTPASKRMTSPRLCLLRTEPSVPPRSHQLASRC